MSGSSIPAARRNLFARLEAAFADQPDVQVVHGPPEEFEAREVVALLGVKPQGSDEDWAAIGALSREENYELQIVIKAHDPDATTGVDVDERAFAIFDVVRAAVHTKPLNLDGAVTQVGVAGAISDGAQPATAGWVTYIDVPVRCMARIGAS